MLAFRAGAWLAALAFLAAPLDASACSLSSFAQTNGAVFAAEPDDGPPVARMTGRCALAARSAGAFVREDSAQDDPTAYLSFYFYAGATGTPVILRAVDSSATPLITATYESAQNRIAFATSAGNGFMNGVMQQRWHRVVLDWDTFAGSMTVELKVVGVAGSSNTVIGGVQPGDRIDAIELGWISGAASPAGSGPANGLLFDAYELRLFGPTFPLVEGDADGNGFIDGNDVLAVQAEIGGSLATGQPDCNGDGLVSNADVACLQAQLPPSFDSDPGSARTIAISGEPGSVTATRTIDVFNASMNGSVLDVTGCTVLGAPEITVLPTGVSSTGPGDLATLTLTCQVPAASTTLAATLECTTNDPFLPTARYGVTCIQRRNETEYIPLDPLVQDGLDAADQFGTSAAIGPGGGDVEVFAIGAPGAGNDEAGRVFVFQRSPADDVIAGAASPKRGAPSSRNESLGQLVAVLKPPSARLAKKGTPIGDKFGAAVAVSPTGRFIAVGSPLRGNGAVYVFEKPAAGWIDFDSVVPDEIVAPAAEAGVSAREFGAQLAFTADEALVVTAPAADVATANAAGAGYVMRLGPSGFDKSGPPLTAPQPEPMARFGHGLAGDSGFVVVGAPLLDMAGAPDAGGIFAVSIDASSVGAVQPIARAGTAAQLSGDKFGSSVSTRNGVLVAGAPGDDPGTGVASGSGVQYLRLPGGAFTEVRTLLPLAGAGQGAGLAVATNGTSIVLGAPLADVEGVPRRGRAYLYELDTASVDAGAPTATIENAGGRSDDAFAQALAISARRLLAGVPNDDDELGGAAPEADEGRVDPYVLDRIFRSAFE